MVSFTDSYLPHFRPARQICREECRHIRCQHEFSQLFYVGPGWQIGRRTSGSQLAFDHLVATPLASCPTPQSMRLFQEGIGLHTFLKSKVLFVHSYISQFIFDERIYEEFFETLTPVTFPNFSLQPFGLSSQLFVFIEIEKHEI